MASSTNFYNELALRQQEAFERMQYRDQQRQQAMFGGALVGLAGLGQAGQQSRIGDFVDRSAPKIKYKPTIEAGDNMREVLQAETDEWLNEIK